MTDDIALGIQNQEIEKEALAAFAAMVNGSWMEQWTDLRGMPPDSGLNTRIHTSHEKKSRQRDHVAEAFIP